MKVDRIFALALTVTTSLLTIFPAIVLATDTAEVAGDLKVDGIHFTSDGSVVRKLTDLSSPWTILDSDIYYLPGNVGVGKQPTTKLDVSGTVAATSFQGDGSALTNVNAATIQGNPSSVFVKVNYFWNDWTAFRSTGALRAAIQGQAEGTQGIGVSGTALSSDGAGGIFNNAASGNALIAQINGYPVMNVDSHGVNVGTNLIVDAGSTNNGTFLDGTAAGYGLAFGMSSGEGIASKRTGGGNQNGLDFYTGHTRRMAISSGGHLAIGADDPDPLALLYVHSDATGNEGMYIKNTNPGGTGLLAIANFGSGAAAVYGASDEGYAGYFSGRVTVTGTLSKAGGSFKIDHPLDPANKYLSHSFVESPDMMNIYNGNVTTDGRGYATIQLPDWFEALNRDFRYQLTVIDETDGAEFVQAKVVHGVKDNSFTIRTSKPETQISWQVTGIRQDAWANAHRIPVEEAKPDKEAGTYLHPELFGQPKTRGINYRLEKDKSIVKAE